MAWTYSDWGSQGTAAARLARLRLHRQEVADAIQTRNTSVGSDGKSMSREGLQQYYDSLERREMQLAAVAGTAGGRSIVRLTRPNSS